MEICRVGLFKKEILKFKIMSRGKIVLGALAGAAAGTLIGILFAPDKGSATRKKIANKGEEYVQNLKGKITGIMNNGEHQRRERVRESAA